VLSVDYWATGIGRSCSHWRYRAIIGFRAACRLNLVLGHMTNEGVFQVWDAVSMAWTEIGLEPSDYPAIAEKLKKEGATWPEVRAIALRDVCGSFAVDSFLIIPCMLWMIMPDWGYNEEYLRRRAQRWAKRPIWLHFLNPLRLLGYPVALLFSMGVRLRLKRALTMALAQPTVQRDGASGGSAR
jgi:hypothetical protein